MPTSRPSSSVPPEQHSTLLAHLERWTLRLEAPLFRWIRDAWFFLFYHTGTLAFWTLILLLVTGLYVTLFYRFGFTGSYASIAAIDANIVGRVMRGLHRYLADLLLILVLLHAWRMFVQNRFKGPRWLAWVSGFGLVLVTWIIGVTGFWMLADTRAQWLHHLLVRTLSAWVSGQHLLVTWILPSPQNNGWLYMVTLFFIHVGLAIGMAVLYWLHIRHLNKPRWFPHQAWMVLVVVLGVLLVLVLPVTRLPMWDFTRWPPRTWLNGFYLFWVPATLSGKSALWVVLAVLFGVAMLFPWIWAPRHRLQPVRLDVEKCIGCTLCAQDCPYRALEMAPREGPGPKWVAQLYPERCVGCGICVGSCPTDALALPDPGGQPETLRRRIRAAVRQEHAPHLVFACYRHLRQHPEVVAQTTANGNGAGSRMRIIGVPCAGVLHPDVVAEAWKEGAASVHIIGCPAEDCPDRYGNTWAEGRFTRTRKPWLRTPWKHAPLRLDWVPPTEFSRILKNRDHTFSVAAMPPALRWHAWVRHPAFWKAALVLAVVFALIGLGNRWAFTGPTWVRAATLEVVVNHVPGTPIEGAQPLTTAATPGLSLMVDERPVDTQPVVLHNGRVVVYMQRPIPPGEHRVQVTLVIGSEAWTLVDRTQTWEGGRVYTFHFRDLRLGGDPERGRKLFLEEVPGKNTGCILCHALEPGERKVGPPLAGIATRAAERVPGMSAEEYLRQSILYPDAYVVPGYPAGTMPPNYAEILTQEDIEDLVAFLMTLREEK